MPCRCCWWRDRNVQIVQMQIEVLDPRPTPARVFDLIFGWDDERGQYFLTEADKSGRKDVFWNGHLTTAIKRSKEYAMQLDAAGCVFVDHDDTALNMKK